MAEAMNMQHSVDSAIEIRRPASRRVDRRRKYNVRIDGELVGSVEAGATVRCPATAGEHVVTLHLDWGGSPPLRLRVDRGQTVELEAQPRLEDPVGFEASMRTFRAAMFDYKRWIDVRPVDSHSDEDSRRSRDC